jgi:hypothetical protein
MEEFSIFYSFSGLGALSGGLINKYFHGQGVLGFQSLFWGTGILHSTHNFIFSGNERGLYTADNQYVARVPDGEMQVAQETTHIGIKWTKLLSDHLIDQLMSRCKAMLLVDQHLKCHFLHLISVH